MPRDPSRWTYIGDGVWRQTARMDPAEAEEPMNAEDAEEPMNVTEAEAGKDYTDMSKPELEAELKSRGLPKYGNKPELIERLLEADAAA